MVKSRDEKVFDGFVLVLLGTVGLIAVLPLMYVFAVSITPFSEVLKNGGFVFIPRKVDLGAYRHLFTSSELPHALWVTVILTGIGTLVNLILTLLMAYPLSRKKLPGRSFFLLMIVFTLLFNGGLIPTYLIVKDLGLLDSIWSMILPNAIWTFNMLIMKSFFESLPEELFESARMDGARELRILVQIVLPLSIPSLITIGLFYTVGHWNEFFQAIMYVTDRKLFPLQVIVREILMLAQEPLENPENIMPTETMQMAAVIMASMPIIIIYPFLQKHFTKGMLLGSVKG